MYSTGVFATKEEIEALTTAVKCSGMFLPGGKPMGTPQEDAHKYALDHGLPETPGFYGCDLRTGEFLSQYEVPKTETRTKEE